jgi:NAD(P)-dependent dehydrogenase (short-subunit alcohol dehydrogenase family)
MTAPVRHVLVTGASSGIGAGIAQAFAADGARVTATGATVAEVDTARARPEMRGIDVALLDVRDDAAVRALVQSLG